MSGLVMKLSATSLPHGWRVRECRGRWYVEHLGEDLKPAFATWDDAMHCAIVWSADIDEAKRGVEQT